MNKRKIKRVIIFLAVLSFIIGGFMSKSDSENKKIRIFNARAGKIEDVEKIVKSNDEWKKILTPEQFRITRLKETEKPESGICEIPQGPGLYECVSCGTDLFNVKAKFESGTGWPSFWEPVSDLNVYLKPDDSYGMRRTEVLCARCDAHLGHIFDDGPPPTGKRYCINAAALKFVKVKPILKTEKATFGAGCFWGVEEIFRTLPGVVSTKVGYTGGNTKNPTYEDVCTDKTRHAEAVEIEYDPSKITYKKLLDIFWNIHDPTQLNRQGPDRGTQYRSVIFFNNSVQEKEALESKKALEKSGKFKGAIVTEIVPAGKFYEAEEYHQKYYMKRGIKPTCHIDLNK